MMPRKLALLICSLMVATLGAALTLGAPPAGATDNGRHHPWESTGSCSLRLSYDDGALILTYIKPGDRPRNVQLYAYSDDASPVGGHVGTSHRHQLVLNETLASGESTEPFVFDPVQLYEVHYAGGWYRTETLANLDCDDGTTTTTAQGTSTTEATTSTTAPTTTSTEATTTSTSPSATSSSTTSTSEATTTTAPTTTQLVTTSSTGPTTTAPGGTSGPVADLDCPGSGTDEALDTQQQAQVVLNANPDDPHDLDPNGDGIACNEDVGVRGTVVIDGSSSTASRLPRTGAGTLGMVLAGLGLAGAGGSALAIRRWGWGR